MSHDDVLSGYRLQLFDLAARTSVSHACRTFGVHRSTYYAWKAQVDRQDPEEIVAQVLAEVEPGAIMLVHDGQNETNDARPRASTLAALPTLLARLSSDGYVFATVSELLAAR